MKIESLISSAENYLSTGAAFPFAGVFPGLAKSGMGGIQCLGGVAFSIIFSAVSLFDSGYKSLRDRSATHILHGASNVIGGLEGIPGVGFVA